jgi:hypothetical protein
MEAILRPLRFKIAITARRDLPQSRRAGRNTRSKGAKSGIERIHMKWTRLHKAHVAVEIHILSQPIINEADRSKPQGLGVHQEPRKDYRLLGPMPK